MNTRSIRVKLRDGEMGAYLAIPEKTPAGVRSGIARWAPISPSRSATLMFRVCIESFPVLTA